MFGRARILLTITACALATPVFAQAPAPTTTAFDGKYLGNASESRVIHNVACPTIVSVAMTITGGKVVIHEIQFTGQRLIYYGSVNPGGEILALLPPNSMMSGTISDKIFAGLSRHGHWCAWNVQMAPAPATTTAFDGKYIGVRRESPKAVSASGVECAPDGVPPPLTITYGVIDSAWGWEGTVNPQGAVVLLNPKWRGVEAQIDAQGTINGRTSDTDCLTTFVWRKQSK